MKDPPYRRGIMSRKIRNKQFFIIDSEHLERVRTRMYGYYLDENGITSEVMYDGEAAPSSQCGAYVIVRRLENEITVEQDYNGSFGLYVFEQDGYFALSNSFLYLVDFLKTRYPLSLDTDYADYLLVADLSSVAYGRTMIREIRLLDRNATVHIGIGDRSYTEKINVPMFQEIELDSEEGIRLLDSWYYRWTGMMRSITQQTSNVTADLSGGFDSRTTFMLLKCSGADLQHINIDSIEDTRHTHKEDFEIASQIASHFGFQLNDGLMLHGERAALSTEESMDLVLSVSLGFNKQINFLTSFYYEPRYRITGAAGASIREFWNMPVDEFLSMERKILDAYPKSVQKRFGDAQERVQRASIEAIARKYGIADLNSPKLPQLLNLEERVRNHFGKDAVETQFGNDIKIAPLMDKDLNSLRKNTDDCPDTNLLVTLIMHRYCPELLEFPFDSNRSIAPQTRAKAAEISARYPMSKEPERTAEKNYVFPDVGEGRVQEVSRRESVDALKHRYMEIYNSDQFQHEIRLYAGAQMDRALRKQVLKLSHNPLRNVYSEMAVVRIMHAVWRSRDGQGSEGLCDKPGASTFSPALRVERKMIEGNVWMDKHVSWRLRKIKNKLLH